MKLRTDDNGDIFSFKSDFERACLNFAGAFMRRRDPTAPGALAEMVQEVRKGATHAIAYHKTSPEDSTSPWHAIEFQQAMDWLIHIVNRWLNYHPDENSEAVRQLYQQTAEVFMETARRVCVDILGGKYTWSFAESLDPL